MGFLHDIQILITKLTQREDPLDFYFDNGEAAKNYWRKFKNKSKAEFCAWHQINWYLNSVNRRIFYNRLKCLPRAITGLDTLIEIYSKEKRFKEILNLLEALTPLLDKDHCYLWTINNTKKKLGLA